MIAELDLIAIFWEGMSVAFFDDNTRPSAMKCSSTGDLRYLFSIASPSRGQQVAKRTAYLIKNIRTVIRIHCITRIHCVMFHPRTVFADTIPGRSPEPVQENTSPEIWDGIDNIDFCAPTGIVVNNAGWD